MAKKSLFEKLGLVESTEPAYEPVDLEAMKSQLSTYNAAEETTVESDVLELEGEDFLTVEEVYTAAQLQDLSKSIFKVDEFSKVLPDNLPTDVKRQSVTGILTASGLSLDSLIEDAQKRLAVLNEVVTKTSQNTVDLVMEKEAEITKLLEAVDSLKQEINDRKTSQEKQNEIVETEKGKINQILKFVASK
jgi:hypothetical protein